MIITDILDMIYDEHQLQCFDLALFITGYIPKPVTLKKHRLTALDMCYTAYIMVLEGKYYG